MLLSAHKVILPQCMCVCVCVCVCVCLCACVSVCLYVCVFNVSNLNTNDVFSSSGKWHSCLRVLGLGQKWWSFFPSFPSFKISINFHFRPISPSRNLSEIHSVVALEYVLLYIFLWCLTILFLWYTQVLMTVSLPHPAFPRRRGRLELRGVFCEEHNHRKRDHLQLQSSHQLCCPAGAVTNPLQILLSTNLWD